MQTLFGFDLSTAQKMMIASVVILVLLILLGLFARSIKGGGLRLKGQGGGRARQPRLGVVDMYDLDRQRQLVLIRRDNVEHLVMIGGPSDVVVETNILRSGSRAAAPVHTEFPPAERIGSHDPFVAMEPPRHEAIPADVLPTRAAPKPRDVEMPVSAAVAATAAVVAAPAVAVALSHEAVGQHAVSVPTPAVQPPSFTRDHAPSPAASATELDSMARQLEEALKRPYSAVRPAQPATEVAAPEPSPEPEPLARIPAEIVAPAVAAVFPSEPPEVTPEPVAPEPTVATKPVSMPTDLAAELEMALGLKPERVEPVTPFHPAPMPDVTEPELSPQDLVARQDALEASHMRDAVESAEVVSETVAETETEVLFEEDAQPVAEAEEPEAAEVKDEEPPAPPPKPAAIDPFSVDAIEAEFARLLGRDPHAKS